MRQYFLTFRDSPITLWDRHSPLLSLSTSPFLCPPYLPIGPHLPTAVLLLRQFGSHSNVIWKPISGSYGFLNEAGALEVVSYKSKNGTGFEILDEGQAQQPQQPQQQPRAQPQPQPQNPLFAAEVPQKQVRIKNRVLHWDIFEVIIPDEKDA